MNRSKKKDPRFWRRWRFAGAVPVDLVLLAVKMGASGSWYKTRGKMD